MHVKSQFLIMAAPAHDGGNIEIDKDQQNEDGIELENGLAHAAEAHALPSAAKENSNASGVQSVCVLFRSRAAKTLL